MQVDFKKYQDGLVPCVIQDALTQKVLMLGYMNEEALRITRDTQKVTFFSRSKNRIWTKGEESGNFLHLISIKVDCDNDALLARVTPQGPTCHKGSDTCWDESNIGGDFLASLAQTIAERKNRPVEKSYTSALFAKGINKIAQKVGEEAVELVIEAKDENKDLFLDEAADLLFHYMILLEAKKCTLSEVEDILKKRHKKMKR